MNQLNRYISSIAVATSLLLGGSSCSMLKKTNKELLQNLDSTQYTINTNNYTYLVKTLSEEYERSCHFYDTAETQKKPDAAKTKIIKNGSGSELINNARGFLGRKYESLYRDGKMLDGQSQYNLVTKKYFVSFNTGHRYETDQKPLVCADLIVESLKNIGKFPFLYAALAQDNKFYLRRVINLERELAQDPNFKVEPCKINTNFQKGDIITTSDKNGNRHIGIVTEVGPDHKPVKVLHASYTAENVVENSYNEFTKKGEYTLVKKISFVAEPQIKLPSNDLSHGDFYETLLQGAQTIAYNGIGYTVLDVISEEKFQDFFKKNTPASSCEDSVGPLQLSNALPGYYANKFSNQRVPATPPTSLILDKPSQESFDLTEKSGMALSPKFYILQKNTGSVVGFYLRAPIQSSGGIAGSPTNTEGVTGDPDQNTLEAEMNEVFSFGNKKIFQNKSTLFENEKTTEEDLDRLYEILFTNPGLTVEVIGFFGGSHPTLPLDRAKTFAKCLINKGIESERISIKGGKEHITRSIEIRVTGFDPALNAKNLRNNPDFLYERLKKKYVCDNLDKDGKQDVHNNLEQIAHTKEGELIMSKTTKRHFVRKGMGVYYNSQGFEDNIRGEISHKDTPFLKLGNIFVRITKSMIVTLDGAKCIVYQDKYYDFDTGFETKTTNN